MPRGHGTGTPKPGRGWGVGKSPHEGKGAAGEPQSQTRLKTRLQAERQMSQRRAGPSSQDAHCRSGSPSAQHSTGTVAGSITTLMKTLSYSEGRMKHRGAAPLDSASQSLRGSSSAPAVCWGEHPGSGTEHLGAEQTGISWGVVPVDGALSMPK